MTKFTNDLKSLDDDQLKAELVQVTEHIDEETAWQEAMHEEIRARATHIIRRVR